MQNTEIHSGSFSSCPPTCGKFAHIISSGQKIFPCLQLCVRNRARQSLEESRMSFRLLEADFRSPLLNQNHTSGFPPSFKLIFLVPEFLSKIHVNQFERQSTDSHHPRACVIKSRRSFYGELAQFMPIFARQIWMGGKVGYQTTPSWRLHICPQIKKNKSSTVVHNGYEN